jgi:hypothetical protein
MAEGSPGSAAFALSGVGHWRPPAKGPCSEGFEASKCLRLGSLSVGPRRQDVVQTGPDSAHNIALCVFYYFILLLSDLLASAALGAERPSNIDRTVKNGHARFLALYLVLCLVNVLLSLRNVLSVNNLLLDLLLTR